MRIDHLAAMELMDITDRQKTDFEIKTSTRLVGTEGVDSLLWVTQDAGAFKGPKHDWEIGCQVFMEKVRNFGTVVQAGGNCGMYARFYGNYFENVWSWEPDELNFYCLERNCVGDKYHLFNCGLGDRPTKLKLHLNSAINVGMHRIIDEPGDTEIRTIDSYDLTECDLMHLDVERFEDKVLTGALETIKKFWPVIILEERHGEEIIIPLGYREYKYAAHDAVYVKD